MEQMSDLTLIDKAQNGDSAAFSLLLSRHYGLIFRTAWKWSGLREDAEDIAQNVCIKLAGILPHYRREAAFTTWLYRVTLNEARDYGRSKARRGREVADEALERFACEVPDAESTMISRCLYRCIAELSEKLRMAVLLVCAEGLSHAQAGEALHCKEGTVSWRLAEARKQLALCLEGKR